METKKVCGKFYTRAVEFSKFFVSILNAFLNQE